MNAMHMSIQYNQIATSFRIREYKKRYAFYMRTIKIKLYFSLRLNRTEQNRTKCKWGQVINEIDK
ncbi:hypothetical protein CW714_08990 [Methanophagales archaeon]|nr:MAG: hypothetical protein CW714_08990 [Methanophagales archaeon]